MILTRDNYWPATIPLPRVDYSGDPINATISSVADEVLRSSRSTREKTYDKLAVSWVLKIAQMDAFKTFYDTSLKNGTSQFIMELRFPKNTELTEWVVRFMDGYRKSYEAPMWTITADLELITPTLISEDT